MRYGRAVMKTPRLLASTAPHAACGLAPFLIMALAGCGSPPPPASTPTPTVKIGPPTPVASGVATAEPAAPPSEAAITLYPVAKIYSLLDITETEGTIEVRTGYDPGGGIIGYYRYTPIVNGAVDFSQETDEVSYVNTASEASVQLAGKRPDLFRHAASGFRSAASDSYFALGRDGTWSGVSVAEGDAIGVGIYTWSQDRLLEWRQSFLMGGEPQDAGEAPNVLPHFRVLRGSDKEAPAIPAALQKRLRKEGYYSTTLKVFRTGEVVSVGTITTTETKIGTLLWRDKPRSPEFFTTEIVDASRPEPRFLGGDSLANVRLLYGDQVLKLDGTSWAADGKLDDRGLPDVWFGAPLVMSGKDGMFARMAAGAPWTRLAAKTEEETVMIPGGTDVAIAVDASGVIWATLGEQLFSSKPPASGPVVITEEDLVKRRKASIVLGGSYDATGEEPGSTWTRKCTTHHVVLDKMPIPSADTTDYPAIRKALKGHPELATVKLVVSREKGHQYLGAQTADEKLAEKLAAVVKKGVKGARVATLCAEPKVVREIKIDFTTGEVVK